MVANARRDPSWQPPATVGGFAAGVFVVLVVVPVVLLFTVPFPPTERRVLEYVAGHKHLTGTERAAATERPRSRP